MVRELFEILSPTFLAAFAGWLWVRSGRSFDRKTISDLIMLIGAPCLIFSSLVSLEVTPAAMMAMAEAAVGSFLIFAFASFVFLRASKLPTHTFLPPLLFGNQGNLGVPLCLFAFGAEGQALALVFFAIGASLQFTVGLFIWSGRFHPRELIRNPIGLAALAAAAAIALELPVPSILTNTTRLLGAFAIPLMLIVLGGAVAEMRVVDLRRSLVLSSFRLAIGLMVGFSLAGFLGFSGTARGVLIVQCVMPAAVFNHLLAQQYKRSPEQVASIVVVSTLLTAVALPFILSLVI